MPEPEELDEPEVELRDDPILDLGDEGGNLGRPSFVMRSLASRYNRAWRAATKLARLATGESPLSVTGGASGSVSGHLGDQKTKVIEGKHK